MTSRRHCVLWAALAISFAVVGCGSGMSTTDATQTPTSPDAASDGAHDGNVDTGKNDDTEVGDGAADQQVSDGNTTVTCSGPPSCDAALPDLGEPNGFRHTSSKVTAKLGDPRHRGRDLFVLESEPVWVLGKFAYGTVDKDIKDEDIDVYLLRGCGTDWEKVGTFRTTKDGQHDTVQGVEDTGGRIFVNLADTSIAPLGVGMHRILMVVAGDHSYANQYIDVVEPGTKVVVTDIDGTLTSSEYAAVSDVVGLDPPQPHPGAAAVMNAFAQRGYHMFYLTARPEWMMHYTRAWLPAHGFPSGVVHTTLSGVGAVGSSASSYKQNELAWLKQNTGIVPSFAFGNKDSDVAAYTAAQVPPDGCYYYQLDSDLNGGHRLESYTSLVQFAQQVPLACQ